MLNLSHKKLDVYVLSLDLTDQVYELTESFPKSEMYSLTSQMRRSSLSVCYNIAEGSARSSARERKRFYEIARSSLVELETQFELSERRKYVTTDMLEMPKAYTERIYKMLCAMITANKRMSGYRRLR